MTAQQLISDELPTLHADDSALLAMQWMDEYKVKHLPVVRDNEYLGLVSDTTILDMINPEASVGSLGGKLQKIGIPGNRHIFHAVKLFGEYQLSSLAVLNEQEHYLGNICIYALMREMSKLMAMNQAGSLVVLEVSQIDYSLTEIAQIVEGNNAQVLGLYVSQIPESTQLEITVKVNRDNVNGILQTFARYDYQVSALFQDREFNEYLKDRYDELMRYLNT